MTWLPELKRRILEELRPGPLHLYELSTELDEAPFRVRAELKGLRRDRLVRDRLKQDRADWELTDRGHRRLAALDQLELPSSSREVI